MGTVKGTGRKLAVYVPKDDEYVIKEIEGIMQSRKDSGLKSSLSFELIRLAKLGLEHKNAKK